MNLNQNNFHETAWPVSSSSILLENFQRTHQRRGTQFEWPPLLLVLDRFRLILANLNRKRQETEEWMWKEARPRHILMKAITLLHLEVSKLKDSSPQIHIHIQKMEEREERVIAPSRIARTSQIAPTQVSSSSSSSIKTHCYFHFFFF